MVEREAAYVENHAGLPLTMRAFFGFARSAVFLLASIALIGMARLAGPTMIRDAFLILWFILSFLNGLHYTRLDIFFRSGFRLFSWIYTVRK